MRRYSVLLVVLGSILWGTDSLLRRPLSGSYSPITIVYVEHWLLSLVLLPSVVRGRHTISTLGKSEWLSLAFIALGGSVGATSLFTFAIKYGNPSATVLLQKSQPLFAVALAALLLKEKPGKWFWFALFPGAAGAYLISAPDWRSGFSFAGYHAGSLAGALGAAFLWAASTVAGRFVVARVKPLLLMGIRFLMAVPVLMLLFYLQAPSEKILPSGAFNIMSIVVMALVPGLLALLLYYTGLQFTIAPFASLAELAFPITAVAANWILLGVHLENSQITGGVLLVGAVTGLALVDSWTKSRIAPRPRNDPYPGLSNHRKWTA